MSVHAAIVGTGVIFLDTQANRYLALADVENDLARREAAGTQLMDDERAQLRAALDDDMARALCRLRDRDGGAICAPKIGAGNAPRVPATGVAAALARIILARLRLRTLGLDASLRWLRSASPVERTRTAAIDIVTAHRASARWFGHHDRCLVRSLALARALRGAGHDCTFVIGVKAPPFAAHAWVQRGDTVLNDTVEHVAPFTPILTL